MDSTSPASTTGSCVRVKCNLTYYILEEVNNGKDNYNRLYCGKFYKGGSINRMKRHLTMVKGDVAPCRSVPYDIIFPMGKN